MGLPLLCQAARRAESALGGAVPEAKGFQTFCAPGWVEASRDLRAGSILLWNIDAFTPIIKTHPGPHTQATWLVTEACGWWTPCLRALHLNEKSPQERDPLQSELKHPAHLYVSAALLNHMGSSQHFHIT